jgi:calcineurin-like phosphoesterase family protein
MELLGMKTTTRRQALSSVPALSARQLKERLLKTREEWRSNTMRHLAIGCLHLGHRRIIVLDNRPFRNDIHMENEIALRWQETVRHRDKVYVLGDFCLYRDEAWATAYLSKLPGRKILILGNHDRWGKAKFLRCGFEAVHKQLSIGNVVMSHRPLVQNPPSGFTNVHAHVHNHSLSLPWLLNVSADVVNYTPYDITRLI